MGTLSAYPAQALSAYKFFKFTYFVCKDSVDTTRMHTHARTHAHTHTLTALACMFWLRQEDATNDVRSF